MPKKIVKKRETKPASVATKPPKVRATRTTKPAPVKTVLTTMPTSTPAQTWGTLMQDKVATVLKKPHSWAEWGARQMNKNRVV